MKGKLVQGVVVATTIEIEQTADFSIDYTADAINVSGGQSRWPGNRCARARRNSRTRALPLCAISVSTLSVLETTCWRGSPDAQGIGYNPDRASHLGAPPSSDPSTKAEGIISEFVSAASFKVGSRKVNASSAKSYNGIAASWPTESALVWRGRYRVTC